MAGTLSLQYMGTTITLSSLKSIQPERNIDTGAIVKQGGITGTTFTYKRWKKIKHRFEFNNISKEDADNLNTWAIEKYTLTYTPDTDTPGTTYQIRIMNDGNPFDWMPNNPPDSKFQGSLMIWEI